MAHGLRGFSVMGGKRGGEDWLALCQGSEGSGMARVRERCDPQGHAPTALLPYLGPTSSFLPPHQDSPHQFSGLSVRRQPSFRYPGDCADTP